MPLVLTGRGWGCARCVDIETRGIVVDFEDEARDPSHTYDHTAFDPGPERRSRGPYKHERKAELEAEREAEASAFIEEEEDFFRGLLGEAPSVAHQNALFAGLGGRGHQ